MKFSWKWLNQLVNINNMHIDQIINQLTLAGFELDSIDNILQSNDKIIDISITPNRPDISSIVGLAKEMSIIFNISLNKQFICNCVCNTNKKSKLKLANNDLKYINYTVINHLQNNQSPRWIKNYLVSYDIKPSSLLEDIRKYIQLKWNYNIYISTLNKANNFNFKDKLDIPYDDNVITLVSKNLVIYSFVKKNAHLGTSYNDFQQAYNEAIYLIQSYGKATIGQLKQYYNSSIKEYQKIVIHQNNIQNILGPIVKTNKQHLSIDEIINILQQLHLQPNYKKKTFQVVIPEYRMSDLTREIDIIEEISRIYGFNNFDDDLLKIHSDKIGNIPVPRTQISHMRLILRNLGLNETLNSSFIHNNKSHNNLITTNNISLYNPMNEYQKILRINLIDNLIYNYLYNYKQKNNPCELFEIGKIFYISSSKIDTLHEYMHLGCILNNNTFSRNSWLDKHQSMKWFHAKGIIEEFFDKLNCNILWKTSNQYSVKNSEFLNSQSKRFNLQKTAIIYDQIKNIPIGIFGQIDKKVFKNFDLDSYINTNIYAFEINVYQLINTIQNKKHTQYLMKPYSLYPSITRDISFNLCKKRNIDNIIIDIKTINKEIIESVQIFNEYYDDQNNTRSIGLRIIYRSNNKTLQTQEIENVHARIKNFLIKI